MIKFILAFLLAFISISCQKHSTDKYIMNNWINTLQRDQGFTDSEYNLIKVEPATDTTILNIDINSITIHFKLRYDNDSLINYDTTVCLPYTMVGRQLIININSKLYRTSYKIKDRYLIFQEIDQIPFFIKNTDFIFSKKIYSQY